MKAVAAKVLRGEKLVTLCSISIPSSTLLTFESLNPLIKQLYILFLLLGNFIAHHISWGSSRFDPCVTLLSKFILENGLIFLNDCSPTFVSDSHGTMTLINLLIKSDSLILKGLITK